ncbi:MAG TPA: HAMP domain-containing sensor histidine kinase, partial [Clostridia bacterium]|nr:HAMP domain-containing sensor histidine kinase [Clostridia bacterium]
AQADPATGAAFRAAPEGPEMRMFVLLTDSSRLLAGQQQRQFLLGGFIAAALLVAGIGLLGARRAFLKQERLNELKDNFVSSVSHELRAPIASVRLMAESLEKRKISDPGKQSDYYRLMSQECRRLSSLIANVLDFSRIEQGRKEYQFEPTDLEAMVRDTINLMRPYAEERQVGLEVVWKRDPRQPAEALVDGKAIQQALINLVDNAIKHAPSKTVVTIGLELVAEPRASALLWVADKGPGIALGEHQKIFERFYRLGSELRRETQGVGIGLSLVKHIVEAHAGRVSVESEPGQGSRFTLHLPLRGGLEIGLGEET